MKTGIQAFCAATALALTMPAATQAQTYVGITGGLTRAEMPCDNVLHCDTRDTGGKITLGHRFDSPLQWRGGVGTASAASPAHASRFAIEGSYTDFGRFRGLNAANSNAFNFHSVALSIGGAYFLDIAPRWTAIGRLGLSTSKVKFSANSRIESQQRTHPYAGLGIGYAVTPELSVDGTFDLTGMRYNGERSRTLLIGVGVSYGF